MPQARPSHVAVPLAGTGQGVHDEPQVSVDVLSTQRSPHSWNPLEQALLLAA
jgi:hypothetical protein